jgi:hypothetical protein
MNVLKVTKISHCIYRKEMQGEKCDENMIGFMSKTSSWKMNP